MNDIGLWLLARLAVHHEYNRHLPKNRQAPLDGFELNGADHMEVMRLQLELAKLAPGYRSGRGDASSQGRRNRR